MDTLIAAVVIGCLGTILVSVAILMVILVIYYIRELLDS